MNSLSKQLVSGTKRIAEVNTHWLKYPAVRMCLSARRVAHITVQSAVPEFQYCVECNELTRHRHAGEPLCKPCQKSS